MYDVCLINYDIIIKSSSFGSTITHNNNYIFIRMYTSPNDYAEHFGVRCK